MTHNPHIGSSLDALLEEESTLAEVSAIAINPKQPTIRLLHRTIFPPFPRTCTPTVK